MRLWTHVCKLPDCAQCQLQSFQLFLVSCWFTVCIVSGGSVPFVRALKSAITSVLWNSYGASTVVYPEPTSTAVNRPHVGTR